MSVTVLDNCTGCGSCIAACPYSALSLEAEYPNGFGRKKAIVDINLCCNCGDCISSCPHQALLLKPGAG